MTTLVTLMLCILLLLTITTGQTICGEQCRFRFCQANGEGTLRKKGTKIIQRGPKAALAPFVCRPKMRLGKVLKTGEALVTPFGSGEAAVPVSKFSPAGLKASYPKKYWRLFPIDFLSGLQGVGRVASKANQNDFVDGLCVVLPILKYEILAKDGSVMKVENGGKASDCVSFETNSPVILVELQWDSGDNFDLEVVEPDGDVVNKDNAKTDTGRLNNDNGVDACGRVPTNKENIQYRRGITIEKGRYTVRVRQFVNCGEGATKYRVRVVINGVTVRDVRGRANKDGGAIVETVAFSF